MVFEKVQDVQVCSAVNSGFQKISCGGMPAFPKKKFVERIIISREPPPFRSSCRLERPLIRRIKTVCLLFLICLLQAAASSQEQPSGSAGFILDDRLLRGDGRHQTLGPAGRCLSADRIEASPGLQGAFNYIHHTPGFTDPIVIGFRDESGPLSLIPVKTVWRPSHLEVQWKARTPAAPDREILIVERKFITEDDVLLDRVSVINLSADPVDIEVRATGAMTPGLERFRSRQVHFDLSKSANLPPFPGRRLFTSRPSRDLVWYEGEECLFQHGASGFFRSASASGGSCLGRGFGRKKDDQVLYAVFCPGIDDPCLCLRYCRPHPGDARYRVEIDGNETGTIAFPSTAPSKASSAAWRYARFPSSRLGAGLHRIALKAERDGSDVHIDGFFILSAEQEPPPLPGTGRFPAGMEEQIPFLPGSIDYDGVRYLLPDPGREMKPVLAALQGGIEGDPAFSFPRSINLDAPALEQGSRAAFHLLAAMAGPRGYRSGSPACFTFVMDDGSKEAVAFPDISKRLSRPGEDLEPAAPWVANESLRLRAAWKYLVLPLMGNPCVQLSYEPPPGRSVRQVVFEKPGSSDIPGRITNDEAIEPARPEIPLLLAATAEVLPGNGRLPVLVGQNSFHQIPVALALAGTEFVAPPMAGGERLLLRSLQLEPGGSEEFSLVAALERKATTAAWKAMEMAEEADPLRRHVAVYRKWYDDFAPSFSCSDPWMEKLWLYRWFLVRQNMAVPATPPLAAPVFFEGRHGGRELEVAPFCASHVLSEVRWLREKRFAVGQVRAFLRTMKPDGFFSRVRIDRQQGQAVHWIPAAALGAFHVHDEPQFLSEILSLLARNVESQVAVFDSDGDGLPAAGLLFESGMGWQPSSSFFSGYDKSKPETRMERPDLAAYLFASCQAMAEGYGLLGEREREAAFRSRAERIRDAAIESLWDDRDRFFYALRERDNQKARCREAAGFAPFALGLCSIEQPYVEAFAYLFDEEEFWTPFPPASAARSVPVFSAAPYQRHDPHSGNSLYMWNGPAWPHAQSLAAEAMARALRSGTPSPVTAELFEEFLHRYTRQQFENGDIDLPLIRECYDSHNGAGYGCLDHFSSTYNDLLIRFVGGVMPSASDSLTLHPLVRSLDHFRFQGLPYHGRDLEIVWVRPGTTNPYAGRPQGYSIYIDGKPAACSPELKKLSVNL